MADDQPTPPSGRDRPPAVVVQHGRSRPVARAVELVKQVAKPPRTIGISGVGLGFLLLMVVGTALLSLPPALAPGARWSVLNAFFTATSAVCVVGLEVVDTGTHWSAFGQAVILGLIQVGGLGVMVASMFILVILRRPISFRDRFEITEISRAGGIRSVAGFIWATVLLTVLFELLGAAALWYRLGGSQGDPEAVWRGVFYAVSAFNNAGFDLAPGLTGMAAYARDPVVLLVIGLLVFFGGLGALVLMDFVTKRSWKALSQHSRLVLVASAGLVVLGFVGILATEFANPETLGSMGVVDKLANALFHSVTARTAGFDALHVSGLKDETQFLLMALMYIGGATGSTAGGIKVTTLAVLVLATVATVQGYEHATGFGARLSHRLVYRALSVAVLALLVIFVATLLLTITEVFLFRQVLFEVVSAFATVGFTTGITPDLSVEGKLTIIIVMYMGRLGPLTLAYALAQRVREPSYSLPERDIGIG